MDLQILPILSPEEVQRFVTEFSTGKFADGKATAFGAAKEVKQNLQMERVSAQPSPLDEIVFNALKRNRDFQDFAIPKRVLPPTYSRYEPGMHYGSHVDSAIMGAPHPIRTDFAMTIFVSSPESYDGGELVIEMAVGEQEIKLAAGEAVVYPATTMHRVAPVTSGVRMAVVTWMQSAVPDSRLRSVLFDLSRSIHHAEDSTDQSGLLLLSKCYHNLLRYAVSL